MDDEYKDRLFGQIGLQLGFYSSEDLELALKKQKADEIKGKKQFIGSYLQEVGKLDYNQIEEILTIQLQTIRGFPKITPNL